MRRALSAIIGSVVIIAVIAAISYFVVVSLQNQPAQIKFVSNGGTNVELIQVEPGNDITAPPTPEKEGYEFTGWYIDRGLTSKYNFSKMPDKSIVLYAGWQEKILTISFYLPLIENNSFVYDGDDIVLNTRAYSTPTVGYGKELAQNKIPVSLLQNYTGFTGVWKFYNAETGDEVTDLTSIKFDITAKPVFSVKQYNLYFYIGSVADGELYETISVDYASSLVLPEETPNKTGHTFKYWTYINDHQEEVELDENKQLSLTVREDLHFGSDYSINSYFVYFYSVEGTRLDTQKITYGELVQDQIDKTREDMQKTGYKFAGWKTAAGQRLDLSTYLVENNIDLYPDFDRAYYRVSFFYTDPNTGERMIWNNSSNQYEIASDSHTYTDDYEYEANAQFPTLPTLVNFKGVDWVGYDGASGFTVITNTEVEVEFERIAYIITFSGNEHTTFRDEGKQVVVTVDESLSRVWTSRIKNGISNPQKTGFEFFGWNTDPAGSGKTFNKDFVLEDDLTVYADWYAYNSSHWAFDAKFLEADDDHDARYVAVVKSYTGSEKKVKIPEQLYSEEHGMINVYQLGNGTSFIQNINRIDYLVIPTNVEVIAAKAFENMGIVSVKFTEGSKLKTIGERAFSCNSGYTSTSQNSITRIELPPSVTQIHETAFRNATRLVSINVDSDNAYYSTIDGVLYNKEKTILYAIPNKLEKTTITIPNTVRTIKAHAASYEMYGIYDPSSCPRVERINFEEGSRLETIEQKAFLNNMNLRYFAEKIVGNNIYTNLPNLEVIETSAFENCYIQTFNFQSSKLETIADNAFKECVMLRNFSLPSTITSIGESAFEKCRNITSVVYPSRVSHIPKKVFSECTNLEAFSFSISASIGYIDEAAFYKTKITSANFNALQYLGEIKTNAFNGTSISGVDLTGLPVRKIGSLAFANCQNLVTFKIPAALELLETDALSMTPALNTVTVETGNINYLAQDNVLYNANVTTLIIYPSGITAGNFNVPSTVTKINKFAFSLNSNLVSVNLSNSVEEIGESAFESCLVLESVNGFNNVSSLGVKAFKNCSRLTTIGGTNGVVNLGDKLVTISEAAFQSCSSITNIVGLGNCTAINKDAFSDCVSLNTIGTNQYTVTIPSNVKYIGNAAFARCTQMTNLNIASSVETIAQGAFSGNTKLQSVQVSSNSKLETLGDYSFSSCTALTTFTFMGSCALTKIGDGSAGGVFSGCIALSSIDLSNCTSLKEIRKHSFYSTGIQSITIPSSVTNLGDEAFASCASLSVVTFNGQIDNIGRNIFIYSTALQTIRVSALYEQHYTDVFGNDYAGLIRTF